MISNPRFIVGRKVESRGQQIIRAIFIFLTPNQQSTVNSQQSTVNSQQARTVQPESIFLNLQLPNFNSTILRAADESFAQKPDRHRRNRARMCI